MPPENDVESAPPQSAAPQNSQTWYNELMSQLYPQKTGSMIIIDNLISIPARVSENMLNASGVASVWGLGKASFMVFVISYTLLLTAVGFPVFILSIVLVGNVDWMEEPNKKPRTHDDEEELENTISKRLLLPGMVKAARVGVFIALVLLPITLSVHRLREARLLGSQLWHWWLLVAAISLFTPIIILFAYFLIEILRKDIQHNKNVFWIRGAENSMRRVLYFGLILLIWVAYFTVDQHEITKAYRRVHEFIILTLVALLVWAILGFLKDIAVLTWMSYFIYTTPKKKDIIFSACELLFPSSSNPKKLAGAKKIEDAFTLQDIDEVARWLTICIPDDIPYIQNSEWEARRRVVLPHWPLLLNFETQIQQLNSLNEDHKERIDRSLAFASKICEEFKMKRILFTILTIVQVAVAFLVWLFITGLAQKDVVLTLGYLVVALAFVFGDTCKTFFQGCIFSFVTHPLDVGDVVLIDSEHSTKLEVRRINVMATRFVEKDHPGNIIIYPNSELATKKITKVTDKMIQVSDGSKQQSESKT